jgi:hypothetical protein
VSSLPDPAEPYFGGISDSPKAGRTVFMGGDAGRHLSQRPLSLRDNHEPDGLSSLLHRPVVAPRVARGQSTVAQNVFGDKADHRRGQPPTPMISVCPHGSHLPRPVRIGPHGGDTDQNTVFHDAAVGISAVTGVVPILNGQG